jgi:hypothetical protein
MSFDALVSRPPFSLAQAEKERLLLSAMNDLMRYHVEHSAEYARIIDAMWGGRQAAKTIADVPFLPVSIFKRTDLVSTREKTMLLTSSGTTGQRPSRIYVDSETSARQSRALVATLKPILGNKRLPFLIIDTRKVISDPTLLTARGAAVLGLMKFGGKATFALDVELEVDKEAIRNFLASHGARPFLIFGFTFLVWSRLFEAFAPGELDLSNAILIHSGGWKTMENQKVANPEFRIRLYKKFGLKRVFNFYGMVEQIGSIFLEASDGHLYPPNFADVIIRDERTWEPLGPGEVGIIQVISALPLSYPGHSLLTEDRGEIMSIDAGVDGRLGRAIRIHGRLPKAELRGCSDVVAASQ